MPTKQFYITEVFAEKPYGGNQLATVVDAADIPAGKMQQIARAFNLSETTFLVGGDAASGFDVRIFTPTSELPFAGHPTLGSAFLIRHLAGGVLPDVTLNLGIGQIRVTFGADEVAWMKQKEPGFGAQVAADAVADTLGLATTLVDSRYPCQYVSTGIEFLVVPVTSLAALRSITVRNDNFDHGLLAFCIQGYEPGQGIAARMFAAALGVVEDPATGSACGCLGAYLVAHRCLDSETVDVRVAQGYEIQRPSQLYLRASRSEAGFDINVGGKVRLVANGEWVV